MRVFQGFKLPKELVDKLEEFSKQTGKNKTQIVEEALKQYLNQSLNEGINESINELNLYKSQLELLENQNKQMTTTLQAFNLLLEEKDKRIEELKEIIQILKQSQNQSEKEHNTKKPSLWRRIFGR